VPGRSEKKQMHHKSVSLWDSRRRGSSKKETCNRTGALNTQGGRRKEGTSIAIEQEVRKGGKQRR